ncbi:MAG: lipopolysaccharide biosynthesis protein [Muribaculaceae bacterium]|nr:lipopolysaccharide biosynthesis protein [Muribaculaceae bacterium]MBR7012829.1 lipopolysaccharide biosynthesis protein [Muribaculaceae bacterium]
MNEGIDNQNLKEKTAQGLFWAFLSSGGMQLLNLIIGIFLARLLSPGEYGIVGMLAIFTLLAGNLQDSGFGVALVNIKDIKHNDYNSVFWFNVGISLLLYLILYLCAPLIASFFHQPCLVSLSRFVFLGFIIASLCISPNAMLVRNLKMKEKAITSLSALLISGTVAVVMALKGFSYWSLATQQVLYNVIICFGRYYYTRWHPTFKVDFTPVKQMFSFSYKVLITAILTTINNNVLTVIFGRLFPAQAVGNFTQANKWNIMANQLVTNTVAQVAQPVLTRVGDDNERQRRVFGKMLRFTAFMAFPAMFGLALVAPQLIIATIGEKWAESIPLLQVLCISGAFIPLYTIYQNLFLSQGKSDTYMWLTITQIAIMLIAVLACHWLGIMAMVIAFAGINVLWILAWQLFAYRLIGYRLTSMLRDLLPFMFIALAVMGVTYFVTLPVSNIYLLLLLRIILAIALYALTMKLLRARIFEECIEFIKSRIKR